MIFDIIILVIVALSAFYYFKKGFAGGILSAIEWFVAVVVSLLICSDLVPFIVNKAGFATSLTESFETRLAGDDAFMLEDVVKTYNGWADSSSDYITTVDPSELTNIFLAAIIFFFICLIVKIITWLFGKLFPTEKYQDFGAFINRLGGLVVGVVIGFFYVLYLMTLLMAIIIGTGAGSSIMSMLDSSFVAGGFFKSDFLFGLLKNLFL